VLRRNQKVELIRDVPLFANLSKKELEEIASIADEIDFREGKELIREGARGREFFVLLDGAVDVTQDGHRINQLGAGDFFGEIALVLPSAVRTATVTASTDVDALVVTAQNFNSLIQRSPKIELKVMRAAAERLSPAGI
jgi:CRP/FNR family transcriptional regulator, cyclic AMP receptor protein